jgi:hypothetical protein
MPAAVDATVGGASANSYVTIAEADAYLVARLNAGAWETDATADEKIRAVIEATRELDRLSWQGRRASTTQALAWPRYWVVDPDSPSAFNVDSTIIPQRVKDATCELALEFLRAGTTDLAALDPTTGVIEKTVDVLTTRYAEPGMRPTGLARYPRILRDIQPFLAGSSVQGRVARG